MSQSLLEPQRSFIIPEPKYKKIASQNYSAIYQNFIQERSTFLSPGDLSHLSFQNRLSIEAKMGLIDRFSRKIHLLSLHFLHQA